MQFGRPLSLRKGLLAGSVCCLWAFSAFAAPVYDLAEGEPVAGDWTLEALIAETGSYSSNPLMAPTGAKSLYGSTTTPEAILTKRTPTTSVKVDTKIEQNIFDLRKFNSTDLRALAALAKSNQRWSASLQSKVDFDTTRTSELTTYGLSPVLSRHLGLSFLPQISFSPSAVDTYTLGGSAAFSQYGKDVFTNYRTLSLSPSYTHRFDPLNAGIFALQAQQYQTTRNNAVRINSFGSTIGWQAILTPRLTASAAVGAQTSRQFAYDRPVDDWRLEYIFSGDLSFKGIQDTLTFSTARAQSPYGNGTEALQTSFGLKEKHKLNPSVTLDFGARYLTAEYQAQTAGDLKDFAAGTVGAAYHVTETFDLTASYQYRYETLTSGAKDVQDHSMMIGLVYHPNMWTLGN